jgi:hypothetical protein
VTFENNRSWHLTKMLVSSFAIGTLEILKGSEQNSRTAAMLTAGRMW